MGNVELFGQRFGNLLLGDEGVVHQHASQLAPGALLLLQCKGELVLRNEFCRTSKSPKRTFSGRAIILP